MLVTQLNVRNQHTDRNGVSFTTYVMRMLDIQLNLRNQHTDRNGVGYKCVCWLFNGDMIITI